MYLGPAPVRSPLPGCPPAKTDWQHAAICATRLSVCTRRQQGWGNRKKGKLTADQSSPVTLIPVRTRWTPCVAHAQPRGHAQLNNSRWQSWERDLPGWVRRLNSSGQASLMPWCWSSPTPSGESPATSTSTARSATTEVAGCARPVLSIAAVTNRIWSGSIARSKDSTSCCTMVGRHCLRTTTRTAHCTWHTPPWIVYQRTEPSMKNTGRNSGVCSRLMSLTTEPPAYGEREVVQFLKKTCGRDGHFRSVSRYNDRRSILPNSAFLNPR